MNRRIVFSAIVLGSASAMQARAEGISFNLPESTPGNAFTSAFESPSPFAGATIATRSSVVIAAPPQDLLAPARPFDQSRTSALGETSTQELERLNNPLGQLTSSNNLLAPVDRYDSGAASRLSGLTASNTVSGLSQQFTNPTASLGAGRSELSGGVQPSLLKPQVYFGAH